MNRAAVALVAFVLALSARGSGQSPAIWLSLPSSAEQSTTSTLEQIFEGHAGGNLRKEPCSAAAFRRYAQLTVAVLTDTDCIAQLEAADVEASQLRPLNAPVFSVPLHIVTGFKAGSQLNASLFTPQKKSLQPSLVFGYIRTDGIAQQQVALALKIQTNGEVSWREFEGPRDLVSALKKGAIGLAFIAEDGLGWNMHQLETAARTAVPQATLEPLTWAELGHLGNPAAKAPAPLPAAFLEPRHLVTPPDSSQLADLALRRPEGVQLREAPESLWARFVEPALHAQAQSTGVRVRLPVLLVRSGSTLPEPFVRAFSRASLAVPARVGANPCQGDTQEVYRAYVLNAVLAARAGGSQKPDRGGALSEWEDARLISGLQVKGGNDRDAAELDHWMTDELLTAALQTERQAAIQQQKAHDHKGPKEECVLPSWRDWFSLRGTTGYFHGAVFALHSALQLEPGNGERKRLIAVACNCLTKAVTQDKTNMPTCGTPDRGMWADYYAPYLVLSVLRNEESAVGP